MDAAADAMWAVFLRSSNARVNALMQTGVQLMQSGDLRGALRVFTEITAAEPTFAEGYNKRATVLYMMARLEESVADCEVVVGLQPLHFGALSGMGLCLYKLGDLPAALAAFDRTLAVHPGLTEIRKLAEQVRARLADEQAGR
uniref:Tetratricopeptide repeat protein n=1 Tax=Tetraselmis chuii TaxID=63592 RepID=A0A7S1T031_9CHLO|mmetsp:Transcript_36918/g.66095  ORF Transcript_36918/g.66095 Transcript_36918/m.66095 type:complete len:143 (+) Transcript_36918:2-430(+)